MITRLLFAALAITIPILPAAAQRISSVADLRSAIAGARANSRVTIPAGVWNIGSTPIRIEGKRNVQIVGAGAGRTIIRASGSAPFIFELAGSNDGLTVADMTLEGASRLSRNTHALASGSDRMNLTRARFHDLEIRNVAVGISVAGTGNGYCDDIQITSNRLDNIQNVVKADGTTSGSGYGIHNDGCTNVRIADNVIRNADRHSIYQAFAYQPGRPRASGSVVIDHNTIIDHGKTSSLDNEWQVALVVARSANVTVSRNEIVNSRFDAISIEDPSGEERTNYSVHDIRLVDNIIRNARTADLFVTAGGTIISKGNRFYHDGSASPSKPVIRRQGNGVSARLASQ
ncbi:MAG TPA: right-handed parallel beta-helix repeat-containing protein [Gemmatimonadaceae bacterium]